MIGLHVTEVELAVEEFRVTDCTRACVRGVVHN